LKFIIIIVFHRKASFARDFVQNEKLSENIHHYFPEACRGLNITKPTDNKDVKWATPATPSKKTTVSASTPPMFNPNYNTIKEISPPPITTPKSNPNIRNNETYTLPTEQSETRSSFSTGPCEKKSCCNDESNQVIIKIPFENTEYCDLSGKLTIPFEGMNTEMFKALKKHTAKSDVIFILKSLVKMLENPSKK
jgi:hypothetical protein